MDKYFSKTGIDKTGVMAAANLLLYELSDAYDEREVVGWLTYLLEGVDHLYGEDVLRPLAGDLQARLDNGGW